MFTGLIQGLGTLQSMGTTQLKITCQPSTSGRILPDLAIGDSVAVNGVCLTVVQLLPQGFVADASPETRDRSTLGRVQGEWVNLERSLRVGSKLGGHFVTGHVDGVEQLQKAVQTATSWEMSFTTDQAHIARYILPKGSIAVNGVSLTIADCDPTGHWFTVAVIPHTYLETTLQYLRSGDPVNLEGDILGKYVEKFLSSPHSADHEPTPLSSGFLAEHGYL